MTLVKAATRGAVWVPLLSVLAVQALVAQCESKTGFAKKACEVENASGTGAQSGPSILEGFKGEALSTNYSDTIHPDTLPPSVEPKAFKPLSKLDRTEDGAFLLKVGIFETYVQCYSLDRGERGAARVGGFYPAPIKGRRARVIADVLKQSELHPDVSQNDIQQLLWVIVQGADLENMPPTIQQTAAKILPKETLALLKGATVAKAVENRVMSIVNKRLGKSQTAAKETEIDRDYGISATAKDVKSATESPVAAASDDVVVRGTWAQMPGGFYVRYLPEGYAKLRLQMIVPDAAVAQAEKPLTFDPTQYLAVFAGSPPQRLGVSLRPAK
jgi:hypothetical protein